MNVGHCISCGDYFDKEDKDSFVHQNLFGGVDMLCKACICIQEEAHNRRIENVKDSKQSRKKCV